MSTGSRFVTPSLRIFAGPDGLPVYIASGGDRRAVIDVSDRFDDKPPAVRDARSLARGGGLTGVLGYFLVVLVPRLIIDGVRLFPRRGYSIMPASRCMEGCEYR